MLENTIEKITTWLERDSYKNLVMIVCVVVALIISITSYGLYFWTVYCGIAVGEFTYYLGYKFCQYLEYFMMEYFDED